MGRFPSKYSIELMPWESIDRSMRSLLYPRCWVRRKMRKKKKTWWLIFWWFWCLGSSNSGLVNQGSVDEMGDELSRWVAASGGRRGWMKWGWRMMWRWMMLIVSWSQLALSKCVWFSNTWWIIKNHQIILPSPIHRLSRIRIGRWTHSSSLILSSFPPSSSISLQLALTHHLIHSAPQR